MGFGQVDLLGFSIGSFVAQQIALTRPAIVRRLVLASSAPQGAGGMHGWAPEVIGAIGTPNTSPEAYLEVFFTRSAQPAGGHRSAAAHVRQDRRPGPGHELGDPRGAVRRGLHLGDPRPRAAAAAQRLQMPVFVANGDSDPMILPHYSYLLAGLSRTPG